MIEKIRKRGKLNGKKKKSILFAVIITLIKSIISTLPLFFLSLFKMTSNVGKEIRRVQRKFI